MELTNCLTTVSLLVRDTFRQSFASGISWVLLGLSTVCILVCLSVSVSGPVSLGPPGENPDSCPARILNPAMRRKSANRECRSPTAR